MRLWWWGLINKIGKTMRGIGWALESWAWDRYWYGPRGIGKNMHPDIAEVTPAHSFRYYWWRRYNR